MTPEEPARDEEMVPVFSSMNASGEMEATTIYQVLEASGIEALLVGPATLPVVEFQVQVQAHQVAEARRVIEEAKAAGPAAADEAELATEGTPADQSRL
jgi:hypothetical protein